MNCICKIPFSAGAGAATGALSALVLSHPIGAAGGALGGAIGGACNVLTNCVLDSLCIDRNNIQARVAREITRLASITLGAVGGYMAAGALLGKTITVGSACALAATQFAIVLAIALPLIVCGGLCLSIRGAPHPYYEEVP